MSHGARALVPGLAARLALFAGLAGVSGCGTQVEVAPVTRGDVGESCEANDHCASGLACVDRVCVGKARDDSQGDGGAPDAGDASAGGPGVQSTQSAAGQSCGRRADCEPGLSCIDWQCRSVDDATDPLLGAPTRGGRGESCRASNDCAAGLGCILGSCRQRDFSIEATPKECFRVECLEKADCCLDFAPDDPALCADLDGSCKMGVQSDCNLFTSLCECNRTCDEGVCVSAVECSGDGDCGGSGVLICVSGRCAQCAGDGDCAADSRCLAGLCRSQCDEDQDCPLLSKCDRHECVDTGCQSDRQCYFITQNPRSRCDEGGACVTPCEDDSECLGPNEGCVDGVCAFVGCDSDAECRAALGLAEGAGAGARASCRKP